MKLRPVIKLDKRNMAMSKKVGDDAMSVYYDIIAIFPIYGHFAAIRRPDSGYMVYKTYIFINSNLLT